MFIACLNQDNEKQKVLFVCSRCGLSVLFCKTSLTSTLASLGRLSVENLHSNFFISPPNQCGEQRDVIDNDIEIDCLNPFPQFKVPKQIVCIYIHAIQRRDRTWQELPIDK